MGLLRSETILPELRIDFTGCGGSIEGIQNFVAGATKFCTIEKADGCFGCGATYFYKTASFFVVIGNKGGSA